MLYDLLVFEPPSFLRPLFRFGRSTSRIRVIWRSWRIAFISSLIVIIPCDGHERCAPCIICILRVSRNIACQPVKLVEMVVLRWLTRRPASEMSVTSCDSGNLKWIQLAEILWLTPELVQVPVLSDFLPGIKMKLHFWIQSFESASWSGCSMQPSLSVHRPTGRPSFGWCRQ